MVLALQRHRFSVSDYHRMVQADILHEDERVELIDGEIVAMSPMSSRHSSVVNRLDSLLHRRCDNAIWVGCQTPIALDETSEPEPDLSLARQRADHYADSHPGPADLLLVVEVAESSYEYDRTVKLPLYAAAGIPLAWLVDLGHGRVDVHSQPRSGIYTQCTIVDRAGRLEIPGSAKRLPVAGFLSA